MDDFSGEGHQMTTPILAPLIQLFDGPEPAPGGSSFRSLQWQPPLLSSKVGLLSGRFFWGGPI